MYAALDYEEAATAYNEGALGLRLLIERSPEILVRALSDGDRALESGDTTAAAEAFGVALIIAPDNPRARAGLQRTEVRDEVVALLERGGRNERSGDHAAAAADYRSALRLDPGSASARAGADRASQAVARSAFSNAMSDALSALDHGDFAQARAALLEAARLRPDAPEVSEALRRVDRVERRQLLAELQRKAEEAEFQEQWQTAAGLYDRVLALDSNLAFAVAGKRRSTIRMELASQIDFVLEHPERLVSDDALADAEGLLATALEIEPRGPDIDRQTVGLNNLVAAHSTFIPVPFRSDNVTDVVIHKVGRLGFFTDKTLELRPGTYTVVGSRPGYRDVRIYLTVRPGAPVPPVVIRCEEAV